MNYLIERIPELEAEITEQRLYIEELKQAMFGVKGLSYDKEQIQSSVDSDPMLTKIIKIESVSKELNELLDQLSDVREKCADVIHKMKTPLYKQILRLIYIKGCSIGNASDVLSYSDEYLKKKHREALREFDLTYKKM